MPFLMYTCIALGGDILSTQTKPAFEPSQYQTFEGHKLPSPWFLWWKGAGLTIHITSNCEIFAIQLGNCYNKPWLLKLYTFSNYGKRWTNKYSKPIPAYPSQNPLFKGSFKWLIVMYGKLCLLTMDWTFPPALPTTTWHSWYISNRVAVDHCEDLLWIFSVGIDQILAVGYNWRKLMVDYFQVEGQVFLWLVNPPPLRYTPQK